MWNSSLLFIQTDKTLVLSVWMNNNDESCWHVFFVYWMVTVLKLEL